jgi:hypothetical protein
MKSIENASAASALCAGLIGVGMTCCLLGAADSGSKLSPSEQFPGPWLELTQEIRDVLTLNNVSACSQAMGRQSSQDPGEYLLYCTRDEKRWTSWHVQPATRTVRGPFTLSEDIPPPDDY